MFHARGQTMNIIKLLRKNKFFFNFEDSELNSIFDSIKGRIVKFSRGQIVAKQGTVAEEIGVLLSGTILKYITRADLTREAAGTMQAGEMFGDVEAFLPDKSLWFSCVAAEEISVLYLTASTVTAHAAENSPYHQKLLVNVLANLAEKIALMSKDTEYLVIKSMRLKIAKLVYDKYTEQNTLDITLGFNRNEMADYLNVSRPSMSREMMRMRDEGMFEFRKDNIKIKNLEAIKAIAEQ
jgi:CRP-like cAMP-binding protein